MTRGVSGVIIGLGLAVLALAGCQSYPAADPPVSPFPANVIRTDERLMIRLEPAEAGTGRAGVLFYPGGLVEADAYVSILAPIAASGHPVIIVRMPLDLAVTAPNRAAGILDEAEGDGRRWVLAGHSLGGAMAARFIAREAEDYPNVSGLVLMGAYPPGSDSVRDSGLPVLVIYAQNDGLLSAQERETAAGLLPPDTVVVEIAGGNHAGFGDYGPQDGDGERTISLGQQHREVVDAILGFLESN